jgi:hypothetical protein
MNIGDYVYIYLFDLEKSLKSMNELRADRFGKIKMINHLQSQHGEVLSYEIELLNNKIVHYNSNNLTTNIVSIDSLIEIIGKAQISSEKKQNLLDQLNNLLS